MLLLIIVILALAFNPSAEDDSLSSKLSEMGKMASNSLSQYGSKLVDDDKCPQKLLKQCDYDKVGQGSNSRIVCCTWYKVENCIRNEAITSCPTHIFKDVNKELNIKSPIDCQDYSFWSPECIYTNDLLMGFSIAGLILIVLLSCICCCICRCCCCCC
ncbi:hypothetical protein HDE_04885 [Halotydeus destructor]|nr:hypothetical protein HDE_04885 [Halotydeus destructor]